MAKTADRLPELPEAEQQGGKKGKSKEEWVSLVDDRVKEATDEGERRQIIVNLNYYLGNQWLTWDSVGKKVVTAANPTNQERIPHNVLRSRVMSKLAKQTKNRLKFEVTPDTNDQERIDVSKAATKFVRVWWDKQEMDRKTRDIFLNGNVKGWCAVKVVFDNTLGQDVTPDAVEGEEDPGRVMTGEIVAAVVDPLCLYIDPAATCDEEIRWIGEEKPRDVEYIKAKYDVEVTADPKTTYLSSVQLNSNSPGSAIDSGKSTSKMAMVRELWIRPCAEYPNGIKVTTAGGHLLDISDAAGDMPYILFGDLPIPGSVKYQSFLQDMIPIQKTINIAKTLMATHMKRMGNSIWAVPQGSDVDEDELTNEVSTIVRFNPQIGAPQRIAPNDLPGFFDRIIEYMQRDLDDMSGVRELSGNALPAGLDTASGLAMMVEQENEKLAVSSQNYERGMKNVLKRVLRLMKKHYTEERQAQILGPDNEMELIAFRGSDLSGEEDVNIVQGSSLPEMRSAQEDRIMTLWKMGTIVNDKGQPDVKAFMRLMGMGDSRELFEQDMLDENKAKLENKTFEEMVQNEALVQLAMGYKQQVEAIQGQNAQLQSRAQQGGLPPDQLQAYLQPVPPPPPILPHVRDFHNHEIHLHLHNAFRKSNAYDRLPPDIQQMVDAHVSEHEQAIAAMASAQPAPPEVQAQQQANAIKQQELQQRGQASQAATAVQMAKIDADKQKLQLKTMADAMRHREDLAHDQKKTDDAMEERMLMSVIAGSGKAE